MPDETPQDSDRTERQDQDRELKKLQVDQTALKQRLAELRVRLDALGSPADHPPKRGR